VNIAAIQALEKRTAELQKANEKIELMEKRIEKLEQMITSTTLDNNQKYSVNK
jgi:prefoldin subunit 5